MKSIRICKLALAALACALITSVQAALPPAVGDMAADFTLNTLGGKSVQLSDLTSNSNVVLVVLRGWPGYQCPLCTAQAHNFIQNAEKFEASGAQVVMVYPGPADELTKHAADFLHDKHWPAEFLLLLDPDYTFTKAYGLRWDAHNETAYPSTFIVSKGGKIVFSHISHQHGDRVKADTVLKFLHKDGPDPGR